MSGGKNIDAAEKAIRRQQAEQFLAKRSRRQKITVISKGAAKRGKKKILRIIETSE